MPRQSAITSLNSNASVAILVIVALAPIPFGSNRPFFWALWAFVLVGFLAVYLIKAGRTRQPLRVPLPVLKLEMMLFLVVAGFMLVQIAPIAGVAPDWLCGPGRCEDAETLTRNPGDTRFAALRWVTYGALFFLVVQTGVNEKRADRMGTILAFTVAGTALYGLAALKVFGDTILFFEKTYYLGVATGPFVNRNSFATFLGIGIVLAISLLITRARDERERKNSNMESIALLSVALLIMLVALIATQSRMGLFATMVGGLVVIVVQYTSAIRSALALSAGAILTVLALSIYGDLIDRMLVLERSAEIRVELFRQVLAMVSDRPWAGHGAGSFRIVFPVYHKPSLDVGVTWEYTHSTYLALWVGMGLVVGSIPPLIVGRIFFRVLRSSDFREKRSAVSCAGIGATTLVALHSLVDFSLEIQGVAMLYTSVLGLCAARPLSPRAFD